jgi:Type II restriction endonuclease EcoO109I
VRSLSLSFKQNVERFVENQISDFHLRRATNVESLRLKELLRSKNPYLFRAKNLESAPGLVQALLDARLSSAEEGMFGTFMEALAVFVSEQKCNGRKSGITGIDLELQRNNVRYLIAIKSGKAWGNATQHKKLRDNFITAVKVLKQNSFVGEIQPTLGICYGRFKTSNNGAYLHVGGQSFWELISGDSNLYMEIIEPIGFRAKEFNDEFHDKRNRALNRMVREFMDDFCLVDGSIDWPKIVTLVSNNI